MRTRFAPSPTGHLHIGGLRTALYSYLVAKQTGGEFLLRIEDTDRERTVPGSLEGIVRALQWAGIPPDEGVLLEHDVVVQKGARGPYIQSERQRQGTYKKYADELVEKGRAYPCFCTQQRLEEMRKAQEARKQAPMYDRHCLRLAPDEIRERLAAGEKHVIRLQVPHERTITFEDDIRGPVQFQGHTIDDQVLLKSDGFPTYHLAHVVDDHFMEIDLVLRAEEWLSSLPKHLLIFEFLGWPVPRFAHVPLLLNPDRSKLSKRHNAVSVQQYMEKGYMPEVIINFLALLGWNPGTTQEIFTLQELIEQFSLERVQKSGAVFDTEKLNWLQGQWMRKIPIADFAARIRPLVAARYHEAAADKDFETKSKLIQERITFFSEAPEMLGVFYATPAVPADLLANEKQKVTPDLLPRVFSILEETLSAVPDNAWSEEKLLQAAKSAMEKEHLKLGQLLWPLRVALTGLPFSPGATEVAAALGKEETIRRVRGAKKAL